MIIALLYRTLLEYHRAQSSGALEKSCYAVCCLCGAPVDPLPMRFRKFIGIFVARSHCSNPSCGTYFTYLPLFAAPGKWYGYPDIEDALLFLAENGEPLSRALARYDKARDDRIDEGRPPGPCTSTVQRWHCELGRSSREAPWQEFAEDSLDSFLTQGWPGPTSTVGPDGLIGESPVILPRLIPQKNQPTTPFREAVPMDADFSRWSPSSALLRMLLAVGQVLLGPLPGFSPPLLGAGLWFFEGRFGRRCLAAADLAGRLIPGLRPNLIVTFQGCRVYPPAEP